MSTPELPIVNLADAVLCHSCNKISPRQSDGLCIVCRSQAVINLTEHFPVVECGARLLSEESEKDICPTK